MRKFLTVAPGGLLAMLMAPAVATWWWQPVAAFFGRRGRWWDADDFAVFYASGDLVASGRGHLLYDMEAQRALQDAASVGADHATLGYYNPPFFALLFAPLSWLPFDRAFQVWTLFSLALLVVACVLLWRIASPLGVAWRIGIVLGFATLYPVTFGLRLGQFSLLLVASWAAAYLLLKQGRDRAAGVALAVLLIKPELLIPVTLFLAWKRRWGVLASLLPLTAVAVAVSIAIIGPAAALRYPSYLSDSAVDGAGTMFGWNGVVASAFGSRYPGRFTLEAALLAVLTCAAVATAWRGTLDVASPRFASQWLLLTLATLLADAHLYLQDLVLLVPAMAAVIAAASGWQRDVAAAIAGAGWFLAGAVNTPLYAHVNVFALYMAVFAAVLMAWLLVDGRKHANSLATLRPSSEKAAA